MDQENTEINPFFARSDVKRILQKMVSELHKYKLEDGRPNIVAPLSAIIQKILSKPEKFDLNCQYNIDLIGDGFISEIVSFSENKGLHGFSVLASIFTSAYRFLLEYQFSRADGDGPDVMQIRKFVQDNMEEFSGLDRSQIIFAEYMMPASILKALVFSREMSEIRNFHKLTTSISAKRLEFEKDLKEREERLDALSENISKVTSSYNFVALSNGFSSILKDRKKSKWVTFSGMLFLGFLMLCPVIGEVYFVFGKINEIEKHRLTLMYVLPAIITIEVILFYFFRVVLSHYASIKAQIIQLDLRVSLCQFIQSYAEFSGKIKQKRQERA